MTVSNITLEIDYNHTNEIKEIFNRYSLSMNDGIIFLLDKIVVNKDIPQELKTYLKLNRKKSLPKEMQEFLELGGSDCWSGNLEEMRKGRVNYGINPNLQIYLSILFFSVYQKTPSLIHH